MYVFVLDGNVSIVGVTEQPDKYVRWDEKGKLKVTG